MIRSEAEFRKAQRDLELARGILEEGHAHWIAQGLTEAEAIQMLEPVELRIAELDDQVVLFERVKAGDLSMFAAFDHVGEALIASRIARGLSQREFADLIGVHESQVSRDERNEYQGVGRERLRELMATLRLRFEGFFQLGGLVMHPRLVLVEQPVIYLQAAGLALDPQEVERNLHNADA